MPKVRVVDIRGTFCGALAVRVGRQKGGMETEITGVGFDRRRFLAGGAVAGGGAVAASLLPPSVHAAMAAPMRHGGLKAVEHVVLLMQENRSFDHYFGRLRGVRGFADRNAIRLPDGAPVYEQPGGGGKVLPFSLREAAERASKDLQYMGSLPHGWTDGQQAHAGGWNNGWIGAKSPATMAYLERRDLPFHYELADTFTVCDAYHCSVFSSTSPNRNYFVSGYTGSEANGRRAVDNAAYDYDHPGYTWTTYAELLQKARVPWKVYQEWDNYTDNNIEFFARFKAIGKKAVPSGYRTIDEFYMAVLDADAAKRAALLAELDRGVTALPREERDLFERALRRGPSGGLAAAFRADVEAGRLPKVSYIVPSAAESEHPGGSSPVQSARITYDILDAIASDPEVWSSTVVFLMYDEYDGLFDHVPPPVPSAGVADEHFEGKPIGLGYRVPLTVISPWTVGGYVNSQVFDHSSLVRFTERWLGVKAPDISDWRRTVAGDLTSVFDFERPGRPPRIARPGEVPPFTGRWRPSPPAEQRMPGQEPGTRPARPLPYGPEASARVVGGKLRLDLVNTGSESVHYALYPYAGELPAPRHFDVRRGERADIAVPKGSYELVLTGPNGFRREFAGRTAATAEVSSKAGGSRDLWVTLRNTGRSALTFELGALAYGGDRRRTVQVKAGQSRTVRWRTREGWYDVEVKVAEDAAFRRRLMGHIENGRPSVSG
ncbi:phosphocholine-specific phospholipase C [Actinomadura fibrosa]|uniref:phospholipase C n=1 Tax=Actinomadura fibrosa TaxID=111802 RepID=A0ABW2XH20_9ACTN|nr:phospholipase C, phosphocholine-specific [Actinomadura fibrosa]